MVLYIYIYIYILWYWIIVVLNWSSMTSFLIDIIERVFMWSTLFFMVQLSIQPSPSVHSTTSNNIVLRNAMLRQPAFLCYSGGMKRSWLRFLQNAFLEKPFGMATYGYSLITLSDLYNSKAHMPFYDVIS